MNEYEYYQWRATCMLYTCLNICVNYWILSNKCPYLLCNVALGLKILRFEKKKKIVRNLRKPPQSRNAVTP